MLVKGGRPENQYSDPVVDNCNFSSKTPADLGEGRLNSQFSSVGPWVISGEGGRRENHKSEYGGELQFTTESNTCNEHGLGSKFLSEEDTAPPFSKIKIPTPNLFLLESSARADKIIGLRPPLLCPLVCTLDEQRNHCLAAKIFHQKNFPISSSTQMLRTASQNTKHFLVIPTRLN